MSSDTDRLLQVPVGQLMSASPIVVAAEATLGDAARLMHRHRISCLPVLDGDALPGLVREADLVAAWADDTLSAGSPVTALMTTDVPRVAPEDTTFEVLALMTRHSVAHVLVLVGARLVGVITQTDLFRRQTSSSVFMVFDIARLDSSDAISEVVARVPQVLRGMVDDGCNAREAGRVITSVSGAVTRRLVELAIQTLGPAPVPFAWLASGSQGRQEQTTAGDQDNFLVIDNRFDAARDGQWFEDFTRLVCHGLDRAGYDFCDGGFMTMNAEWRQPVDGWLQYVEEWTRTPNPQARMALCLLLDARVVAGDAPLHQCIGEAARAAIREQGNLLSRLCADTLTHPPALGMFGQIAVQKSGEHRDHLDLKHGAIRPIVELARLHAAAAGSSAVNTHARLRGREGSRILTRAGASDLYAAHDYISLLRLRHQADRVRHGQVPDNFLLLESLPRLEQDHLRNSLALVRDIQQSLTRRLAVSGV